MRSPQQSHIRVLDKITPALPLLQSTSLLSETFKAFVDLHEEPILSLQNSTNPKPLAEERKHITAQLPIRRLTDLLLKPARVVYNIMGDKHYSIKEESFGFQYFDKNEEAVSAIQDTGNVSASCLRFESNFESGNLLLAYQVSQEEYYLVIRPDYNTTSFCQWFYFLVRNTSQSPLKAKFSIINMTKSSSLFSQGMKIMTMNSESREWVRSGTHISYVRNNLKRFGTEEHYCTLSWHITIGPKEHLLMAYSQPYSFSQLNRDLDKLEDSKYVKRSILARSILQNRLDLITISSGLPGCGKNEVVIITARTHPVETVSSYVMKGVIQFLISEAPEAQLLRERYIFKLVPMINPDGVIHGNSRCTLAGVDPNRHWESPANQSPEVTELKRFILQHKERLVMYCDLHGHSKKKNIFAYGCNDKSKPFASRQLPYILSRLFDAFSFQDCNFKVDKYKSGTARVSLWKSLKLPYIFTLQSSFCSSEKSNMHLDEEGYRTMGAMLCKAINICFSHNYSSENEINRSFRELRSNLVAELGKQKGLLAVGMREGQSSESEEEDNSVLNEMEAQSKSYHLDIDLTSARLAQSPPPRNRSRYGHSNSSSDQIEVMKKLKVLSGKHLYKRISETRLEKESKTCRNPIDQQTLQTQNSQTTEERLRNQSNSRFKKTLADLLKAGKEPFKSQTPRSYLQRKIVNFDFASKLEDIDNEARVKFKATRNKLKECETFREVYDSMSKTVRKDNLLRLIQDKIKAGEQPKKEVSYRKRNFNNRLEVFLKKMNQREEQQ